MTVSLSDLTSAIDANEPKARDFLKSLIAVPSLSGQEVAAMELAARAFGEFAKVEKVPLDNSLKNDPLYCDVLEDLDYTDRFNLSVTLPGAGDAKPLLINTHMDTVPPSQGQSNPFDPGEEDGKIFGRGACDAKGQVAALYLAMLALKDLGSPCDGDLIGHVVVEEEVGGNGSLAMARRGGVSPGACIVLEPTDNAIFTSIRGAVWFRMDLSGQAGHSGGTGRVSALKLATRVMDILERYHTELLAASKGIDLFDKYENPMPLTLGKLHAGNWPATNPSHARLEGVLGLLPNITAQEVMAQIRRLLIEQGPPELADNLKAHFPYRHDSSVCPTDAAIVIDMKAAISAMGQQPHIDAMCASCDACFYSGLLGVPTVVFGPGNLKFAHSSDEHIDMADISAAGKIIAATSAQGVLK